MPKKYLYDYFKFYSNTTPPPHPTQPQKKFFLKWKNKWNTYTNTGCFAHPYTRLHLFYILLSNCLPRTTSRWDEPGIIYDWDTSHYKPDFHGSSAASLVDPTSVMKFMGGLLSIATVDPQLFPLVQHSSFLCPPTQEFIWYLRFSDFLASP